MQVALRLFSGSGSGMKKALRKLALEMRSSRGTNRDKLCATSVAHQPSHGMSAKKTRLSAQGFRCRHSAVIQRDWLERVLS